MGYVNDDNGTRVGGRRDFFSKWNCRRDGCSKEMQCSVPASWTRDAVDAHSLIGVCYSVPNTIEELIGYMIQS